MDLVAVLGLEHVHAPEVVQRRVQLLEALVEVRRALAPGQERPVQRGEVLGRAEGAHVHADPLVALRARVHDGALEARAQVEGVPGRGEQGPVEQVPVRVPKGAADATPGLRAVVAQDEIPAGSNRGALDLGHVRPGESYRGRAAAS